MHTQLTLLEFNPGECPTATIRIETRVKINARTVHCVMNVTMNAGKINCYSNNLDTTVTMDHFYAANAFPLLFGSDFFSLNINTETCPFHIV